MGITPEMALGAAQKYADKNAMGIQNVTADNPNHKIIIEKKDGSTAELTFDALRDIADVEKVTDKNEIKVVYSDGTKSSAIAIPTVKSVAHADTEAEALTQIESYIADDIEMVVLDDEDGMGEDISSLKQEINDLKDNNVSVFKFCESQLDVSSNCIYVSGRYLYNGVSRALRKYDISIESEPQLVSTLSLNQYMVVSGIVEKDGYLYVSMRDSSPGQNTNPNLTFYGELYVIDIATFSIVKDIELRWKATRCLINNDILVVNMQLKGFQIYNIADVQNPTLLSDYVLEVSAAREYQGGDFYEKDGKLYYVSGSFSYGSYVYDLSDLTNPTEIGGIKIRNLIGADFHIYDVYVDYPYVYGTLASPKTAFGTDNDKRGIIRYDLSDLTKLSQLKPDFTFTPIDSDDLSDYHNDGDTKPTKMVYHDGYLIADSGDKGLALFKLNADKTVTYIKLIKTNGKGVPFSVFACSDGRIVTTDIASDLHGKYMYIYRISQ